MTNANPARADRLAYYLLKAVNSAHRRYRFFQDGDRILVAVSGGKDSLTLLDLLCRRLRTGRERYTLVAAHIESDAYCGRAVPRPWLEAFCRGWGIPLVVEPMTVMEELRQARKRCFRCSWNRRKALFTLADRLGCNKLAFGHHADDIAQTVLLNLFYSGRIEPMEAKVSFFQGKLIVIRPLAFVEERDIVPYAKARGFPLCGEPCPYGLNSRRMLMKEVLRMVEKDNPRAKRSIYNAIDRYQKRLLHCSGKKGREPQEELSENETSALS